MQSEGNANHFVSLGLNFGILILCVPPTWIVLSGLDKSHEEVVKGSDGGSLDEERMSAEGEDEGGDVGEEAKVVQR